MKAKGIAREVEKSKNGIFVELRPNLVGLADYKEGIEYGEHINVYIKIVLSLIAFVCMILYAPADTYKRPLINAKKRKIYKIFSIIISFIYVIIIFTFEDKIISNYLFMGLLAATMMIHPLTYRVFQLPYNNYKTYNASNY